MGGDYYNFKGRPTIRSRSTFFTSPCYFIFPSHGCQTHPYQWLLNRRGEINAQLPFLLCNQYYFYKQKFIIVPILLRGYFQPHAHHFSKMFIISFLYYLPTLHPFLVSPMCLLFLSVANMSGDGYCRQYASRRTFEVIFEWNFIYWVPEFHSIKLHL